MGDEQCFLHVGLGHSERCSESSCPFWENGRTKVERGCLLQRLLPAKDWTPDLAGRWLSLRGRIEEREREARSGRLVHTASLNGSAPDALWGDALSAAYRGRNQ